MKILIDGDACPVKNEVLEVASNENLKVLFFCSISHYSTNSIFEEKVLVDNEDQAVDMKIINYLSVDDIVITGDYGLASLVLSKKAHALSFDGKRFTKDNIDLYLYQRYLSEEQRKQKLKTAKQRKRQKKDNNNFKTSLENLVNELKKPQ